MTSGVRAIRYETYPSLRLLLRDCVGSVSLKILVRPEPFRFNPRSGNPWEIQLDIPIPPDPNDFQYMDP